MGSVMLIAMGGLTCWSLLRSLRFGEMAEFSLGSVLLALLLSGASCLFLYAGLTLAHGWIANRIDILRITDEGVGHFGKFTKWEEIKWFSCDCKRKGELMLFFQKKGLGFDRFLPVTEPIPEDSINALFDQLRLEVAPRHKNLQIG